jgi:RNA polymerase sigma factor (sigma-70 family)
MKRPFEQIVADHGATVLRICRALLARPDVDDVWSETFLAALRAYPELPEDARVEAWLVTIAYRKAIDQTRANRRRPLPVADPPERGATGDGWQPPDEALWAALRVLPDKQRRAVALHHVGGLPYAEVAEQLGGTVPAARRAAADGIATLRRTYKSDTKLNEGDR